MNDEKIEENINKVFNIDSVAEEKSTDLVIQDNNVVFVDKDIETELSNRQEELSVLLKDTQGIIETAKEGVLTWGKPSNVQAYAKLLDSTVNVINSIKAVNEKKHEIKEGKEKGGNKVQNNFILSGDSREILSVIEKALKK